MEKTDVRLLYVIVTVPTSTSLPHVRAILVCFTSSEWRFVTSLSQQVAGLPGVPSLPNTCYSCGTQALEPGKTSFFQALVFRRRLRVVTIEIVSDVKVVVADLG